MAKLQLKAGRKALQTGDFRRALAHFERAYEVSPENPVVIEQLALARQAAGKLEAALELFEQLVVAGKASPAVLRATGDLLLGQGEPARGLPVLEQAAAQSPRDAEAHHLLAAACYQLGELDRAVQAMTRSFETGGVLSSLGSLATMIPGAPSARQGDILETRRQFAEEMAKSSSLADRPRPPRHDHGLPRIGYLSAHFHGENYMKPVWALLNHHDRSRFAFHLLADDRDPSSEFAGYHPHPGDHVHHVEALTNPQLADFIAEQEIDLLVDLGGFSTPDRLELFLSPVAPVVATWFNSFATSGFPGLDHLIGDAEAIKPGEDEFYSETVHRLPLSYLTFEVTHDAPPVTPPPCLERGAITFGSLVTLYKITPPVLDAWAAILAGAPQSTLALGNTGLQSQENARWIRARFSERGIDPTRLTILPPADHYDFLRHYEQIDLALDAFPYNGGTTTMEAIWQGVPVLTFDGDRWASRTSQTILRRTPLAEFVSEDAEGMVALAVALAEDPDTPARLATLRSGMRDELRSSPACDGAALATAMEGLYEKLLTEP